MVANKMPDATPPLEPNGVIFALPPPFEEMLPRDTPGSKVYMIVNKVTGRRYIGQTITTMVARWKGNANTNYGHLPRLWSLSHESPLMQQDFIDHGPESFEHREMFNVTTWVNRFMRHVRGMTGPDNVRLFEHFWISIFLPEYNVYDNYRAPDMRTLRDRMLKNLENGGHVDAQVIQCVAGLAIRELGAKFGGIQDICTEQREPNLFLQTIYFGTHRDTHIIRSAMTYDLEAFGVTLAKHAVREASPDRFELKMLWRSHPRP